MDGVLTAKKKIADLIKQAAEKAARGQLEAAGAPSLEP